MELAVTVTASAAALLFMAWALSFSRYRRRAEGCCASRRLVIGLQASSRRTPSPPHLDSGPPAT